MIKFRTRVGFGAIALAGLSACSTGGEEKLKVSHGSVAQALEVNTESTIVGATDAASFLKDSSSLADLLSLFGGTSESCSGSGPAVVCASTEDCMPPPLECETTTNEVTAEDMADFEANVREGIDDLLEELKTNIFNEANVESDDGDSITYRLSAEQLCGSDDAPAASDVAPTRDGEPAQGPAIEEQGESDCVAELEKYPVRLVVTSERENDVDVALVLSNARINPITFELHQGRLAVRADLAALQSAIEEMGQDLAGLKQMSGKLSLELLKNAEKDFSLRMNADSDISVVAETDEGQGITVSLKKSAPTIELRANAAAKIITAAYDCGALSVAGPLAAFRSVFEEGSDEPTAPGSGPVPPEVIAPKAYTGDIELLVAGYNGSVTFDGGADELQFSGVGLGDVSTSLKHNGTTLFQLDLNPDAGRRADVSIAHQGDGESVIGLSPGLDLTAAFNFGSIADQVEVPDFLLQDTLRLLISGPGAQMKFGESQMEVLSGSFSLSSSAQPAADLEVAAGMCLLVAPDDETASVHELLSQFEVGSCE